MKYSILFCILVQLTLCSSSHLNDRNFDEAIDKTAFSLIYFYSSNCDYCKEFTPIFQRISKDTKLEEQGISFYKIDAIAYSDIRDKYAVTSYPSILLFWKNIPLPILFLKVRKELELREWLNKTTKSNQNKYEDVAKLSVSQREQYRVLLFYGKKDSLQHNIVKVMAHRDGYFVWAQVEDKDTSVMIGDQIIKEFNIELLEETMRKVYARLYSLEEESWLKVVEKKIFSVVYFNKHHDRKTRKLLQTLAKEMYNIHFLQINIATQGDESQFKPALNHFKISDGEHIVAVQWSYSAIFMANMSYTEPNLRDFIEKAKAHEWEVYKMTEKAEKPNKLTRENYEAKMSTKQDVLLFLYDRNEKLSKDIMKIFVHLQKRLQKEENILLLRCDTSANQIEDKLGFLVKPLPRVVFFRNRMKDYPIHYQQKVISPQNVINFIQENTTFDIEQEL